MKRFSILLYLILTAHQISAAVAHTQPPSAGGGGYASASYTVNGSNFDEFVWDSFSVATTQTLREIQWRGTSLSASHIEFVIKINTIALPGGTVWHVAGNAHETPVGTTGYSDFRFTLPAGFFMTGGQTYWMQIYAVENDLPPNWQWSAGTGGNSTHVAQVPAVTGDYNYVNRAGDTAFTMLNAATEPVTITVDRMPAASGSVTGGGTFNPGDSVTVTATPIIDRAFINWTEAGVVVSTNASFTFSADGHKTLTANFTGPNTGPYMINAVANPGVYGNVGGAGMVNAGEIRELDISAADGLSFVGWTENGEIVTLPYNDANQVYEVTATADRNLVANFAYRYDSLIHGVVSPLSSGSIVIAGTAGLSSKSYVGGTPITLNATSYSGYHFAYWKQGAGLGDLSGAPHVVGTSNPSLKHMVCYGTTITAHFEKNFPTLSTSSFPLGSGSITGGGTYAHGSNVTVNAVPAVGYIFSQWRQGTTVLSTDPSYTYTLTNDTTLTAEFIATNRTIITTAVPTEGGSVTGAGVVGNGASVTLTATAEPGYYFSEWTLDGAPAGAVNPATFNALADHTFEANFNPLPVLNVAPATGSGFSLSWPASFTDWILQENPDLDPANWTDSTLPITTNAGQNQISITNPTGSRFFRLARP